MRSPPAVISIVFALIFSSAMTRPAFAGNAPTSKPDVNVGIVLFDGVQIIDFAGPYEVFGTAGFGVVTLTRDGKPITTAMGLRVSPDHDFASAPAFDVLLVPGGDVGDAQQDRALLDFIRSRAANAEHVLSVCTGAHVLGAAGLLDGLQATTFTPRIDQLARQYPKIKVIRDVRWTDNGKIITSAGLSSGLDAALHVVDRLRGTDMARSTALHLEYDWRPEGGFVRSRMADRYMPGLRDVAWPEGTEFERTVSVGDERAWRMHYNVTSPTTPDALMQLIVEGIQSEGGWTRMPGAGTYRWEGERENRRVVLSFTPTPSETTDGFELEVTLNADNALPVSPAAP